MWRIATFAGWAWVWAGMSARWKDVSHNVNEESGHRRCWCVYQHHWCVRGRPNVLISSRVAAFACGAARAVPVGGTMMSAGDLESVMQTMSVLNNMRARYWYMYRARIWCSCRPYRHVAPWCVSCALGLLCTLGLLCALGLLCTLGLLFPSAL